MWPAKYSVSIGTLGADALFVSALQRSDEPSVDQVQQAITAAVRAFGRAGCAERAAQEFGDHSETAVIRMRCPLVRHQTRRAARRSEADRH